jgi:hypothetical protein
LHSPDDKHFPLAKAKRPSRPRRAVSKNDFSLPKPYRRQLFSEEPERLTRLQVGMLAFAGLMITSLIGVLALLSHERERSPDGKVIVAAARLESVEAAEAQLASYAPPVPPPEAPLPPALLHGPRTADPVQAAKPPAPPRALAVSKLKAKVTTKAKAKAKPKQPTRLALGPKKPVKRTQAMAALLAREKKAKAPRKIPAVTVPVPAPDPDVALIAAIMLLTPAPVPASAPSVSMELAGRAQKACVPAIPKDPACTELHKVKP